MTPDTTANKRTAFDMSKGTANLAALRQREASLPSYKQHRWLTIYSMYERRKIREKSECPPNDGLVTYDQSCYIP